MDHPIRDDNKNNESPMKAQGEGGDTSEEGKNRDHQMQHLF